MRDTTDVIRMTKYVSKRCFDKILIYTDMDMPKLSPFEEVFQLMLHHLRFLKHVFGMDLTDSVGVYLQNSTQLPDNIFSSLKNVLPKSSQVRN